MSLNSCLKSIGAVVFSIAMSTVAVPADEIKQPDAAGSFYPASRAELSAMLSSFLTAVDSGGMSPGMRKVFALISPHAGYPFSGRCAAYGYRRIQGNRYSTVIVIGTGHRYGFPGIAVYPAGAFRTPLGDIPIDETAARALIDGKRIRFEPRAFEREHSVEVQLPFLQAVLADFRIVPVVTGECSFDDCRALAARLAAVIGGRDDVLVVVSSDLYHGYDYDEAKSVDAATVSRVTELDARGLYDGIRAHTLQMCGGYGTVAALLLARDLGYDSVAVLQQTDSAVETRRMNKGVWTVGYASIAIGSGGGKGDMLMLTDEQKRRLLAIARQTIEAYVKTGARPEISENDPVLKKQLGAFVTLHKHGELRGCIGAMTASQPLYLTIRDMAIESSTGDPRFSPMRAGELKDIDIEISVLSPLEKAESAEAVCMGTHGVLVRRGLSCGVFLPQVAVETGWTREEFLSCLCSQKAGLPADAWKDKATELYTFTAVVFSEKEFNP